MMDMMSQLLLRKKINLIVFRKFWYADAYVMDKNVVK